MATSCSFSQNYPISHSINTPWDGSEGEPSTSGETRLPIRVIQGGNRNDFALTWGMNKAVLSQIDTDVIDSAPPCTEKYQVAWAKILPRNGLRTGKL